MLASAMVGGWRRALSAPRRWRSRHSGSAAWGCPSSTAAPTRARRSRRSKRALELGVTFLDTADVYGVGANERLVGKAIAGRRDGRRGRDEVRERPRSERRVPRHRRQPGVRAEGLRGVARAPRRRDDRPLLPAPGRPEDADRGDGRRDGRARRGGKVRHLGLSEAAPETIRRAHAVHPITALQTEYSLWTRDPEAEVLPTVRELGHRLRRLQPARPRLPLRPDPLGGRPRRDGLPPTRAALPGRQSAAAISSSSPLSSRWRPRRA